MKRSIAAGRGLTILWLFGTAQVMCQPIIDEESAELYRAVSENKVGLVTQMITDKGFARASRQLHMSPLRASDMNPTTDDDDDDVTSTTTITATNDNYNDVTATATDNNDDNVTATVAEAQKQYYRQRPNLRLHPYMTPGVDNTETFERPAEMFGDAAKENLPVFRKHESPYPNYDGQEIEHYPQNSNMFFKRPTGRHVKTSERMLINPNYFRQTPGVKF